MSPEDSNEERVGSAGFPPLQRLDFRVLVILIVVYQLK